jgi:hypothetical protein
VKYQTQDQSRSPTQTNLIFKDKIRKKNQSKKLVKKNIAIKKKGSILIEKDEDEIAKPLIL